MVTTRCALIFLVSACLWGMSCTNPTPSDASPIFTTQPKMPAITWPASSSTKLSIVPSPASTASTSTISPTQEFTECWPNKTSQCPENWYQVDNDTCLLVIRKANKPTPRLECQEYYSKPVNIRNITKLRSCLTKILGEAKGASNNYIARVNSKSYVNVQSGTETKATETYSVICANITFQPPTVSSFSLQIQTKTFVDNGTDYVTVQTAYEYVFLTCHADGTPSPRVKITDESLQQITSGSWVRLDVCRRAVFTCTANNSVGSSQVHRRILILHPLKVTQFNATVKNSRQEIRSGATVELSCAVDGCPDNITITRNAHPIPETANYTSTLVHEIQKVNCSHMGTYTCLAKSPTGQDGQKTADLEVGGCPVSLCQEEDTSREISPTLGENVTFSLCLMSSEGLKYSANEIKIIVTLTRNPITSFYWTVNITMYNIQVNDYRTHTVRIWNNNGSLDVHFTLRDEDSTRTLVGQKAQQHETDSMVLLIALPVVCVIILVFIIVGIVCYRGRLTSRRRSEDIIDCGSGNDNSGEGSRQVLEEFPEAHAPENPHYEEIINFRSDMPGSRKVLEELPEAQAPENPHYEEIVDFRSDMPVMYANLRETSVGRMPEQQEAEQQQEAGRLQRQEDFTTTDLQNKKSVRFTTDDGTIYFNVVT